MMQEIKEFIDYLEKVKKISKNTLVSYERDIKNMERFFVSQGITEISQITETSLELYIMHLEKEGKKPSTISRHIVSMRAFFHYLQMKNYTTVDIGKNLKAPKIERKTPDVLSAQEVDLLLNQPYGDTPKELRDRAMLELLYATGIRVSELISLEVDDLNLQMGYIRCSSVQRERVIPFGKIAKQALEEYMVHGRDAFMKEENTSLFTNCSGNKMSRQGFWKLIKTYGKKAGIEHDITPHILRHSFAAHLIHNGADIHAVKEMMGHADIATTQVYTKMREGSIREVYNKAHPRG